MTTWELSAQPSLERFVLRHHFKTTRVGRGGYLGHLPRAVLAAPGIVAAGPSLAARTLLAAPDIVAARRVLAAQAIRVHHRPRLLFPQWGGARSLAHL